MDITSFDLFPTSIPEDEIYYLPEAEPLNINFESAGIESKLFTSNIGSAMFITIAYATGAILSLVFYKNKRVWIKIRKVIYWNGILRLFLELYQDLALQSYLNIMTAEWDSVYPSVQYSNYLSVFVISLVVALPVYCALIAFRCRSRWND